MRRLILTLALTLLGPTACASANAHRYYDGYYYGPQTSTYCSVGGERSGADLQAATGVCDWRFGVVQNGSDTPQVYKQCMLQQGWEYAYTTRDDTYPDPRHPGLACHDFVIFGIVGSSCSNF